MRKVSGLLMVVAMVAALVPSTTLAGKPPPPGVDGVVVQGTTQWPDATECALHMQVTYHGRATHVALSNPQSILSAIRYVRAAKSGAISAYDDVSGASLAEVVTWEVYLVDRKLNPVSPIFTVSETWSESTCPGQGIEIARKPPLPPM